MTSLRGDVATGVARALEPDERAWAVADAPSRAEEHAPASPRTTVLIADRLATRVGIRLALDEEAEVLVDVADTEQAIRAAKREQPDVCLVGDGMAGDVLAAVRGICRAAPQASVVVLVQDPDVDFLLDAVRAGAIGYVPGPLDAEELRRVVKAAAAKEAVVPRSMVLELLLELRGRGSGADALTSRESQVLGLIRRGHTTSEIAARLVIAPVTVRRHASELVRKLGVANRAALVSGAARSPSSR